MSTIRSARDTYEMNHSTPTVGVVQAIAELENTDPMSLPPLYESIDIEAVARICQRLDDGQVTFTYHGYRVTVDDTMEFTVEPA